MRSMLAIAFAFATIVFIAQPARADFTPPNTPKLTKSVEITAPTGAVSSFFDDANDVIHVIGTDTLTTYDAVTLEIKAFSTLNSEAGESFWEYGNGFDPEHATVFATKLDGVGASLQGWQYLPVDGTYALSDMNIPAYRTVVYSSALDRVYSIATASVGNQEPFVAAATRNPDTTGWEPGPAYDNIDFGGDNTAVQEVVASSTGKLVGTYLTTGSGGPGPGDSTINRKSIYTFADTGNSLVPTEITGTAFDPGTIPYPTSLPIGYKGFVARPGGSVTATEFGEWPVLQTITVDEDGADPSGFAVSPDSFPFPFSPLFTASDVGAGLYVATSDTVSMYSPGLVASSDAGPTVRGISGGDGRVYAFTGASAPYKLAAMSLGGYSPSIVTDPSVQNVTVTGSETKPVMFQSAGTGTPTPTVRWQKQLAGQPTWNDIVGASSSDLTFNAGAADNGNRYRAIYTNVAGEIDTASAQLNVTVNTPVIPPVIPILPIELPAPAAVQVKNGKSVKLKYKKGKSVRVAVGTVTCASATTCVYTLPRSIKFKIGKKSFKASISGPTSLEPGKSQAIYAKVPATAIKALKGKKSKLTVSVKVANTAGRMHDMAKSIISKISA